MFQLKIRQLLAIASLLLGSLSVSANADRTGEDALIEKFSLVYLKLAPKDPAKAGVTLRLADLLAERARRSSIEDLSKGQKDRKEAIRYYKEAVNDAPETSRARIWIQVGHLHELNGDVTSAVQAYTQVLNMPVTTPEQRADAYLSLGEVAFKQRRFQAAREYFTKVVENSQATSKGLASYRIAWTLFNQGMIEQGIEGLIKILRSPDLLRRGAQAGGVDTQFQEEVSRDLATFMAKRRVQAKDLNLLYELSPENAKIANLTYLAAEAERLGQIQEALGLWRFVNEKQADPRERLESQIHIAQLEMARQDFAVALQNYETALQLWKSLGGCTDDACKELKARLKNIVVDWNKLQKSNPTAELLRAYQAYHSVFPEDINMTLYMAQVARQTKTYDVAYTTFKEVGAKPGENQEAALLSAIETAEMAQNKQWLQEAYDNYLTLSPKKAQEAQVRYQRAKLIYDQGDNEKAAVALYEYATSKNASPQLRDQAANLALDALGQLKDDERIQAWAEEFARIIPATATEKREVARKALLNQVARLSEQGELEKAWAVMQRDNFQGAPPAERAIYLKNKLVLAEKMKKYGDARTVADELIAAPGAKSEDREYALSRKAWLSELVLDFESALAATQKLSPAAKDPVAEEKRLLKLAMYADLAAKETKPFYTQYLKVSRDDKNRIAIAAQLVKASKQPLKELESYRQILGKDPEVLSRIYLELYGKALSADVLKKVLSQPALLKTASGPILKRQQFLGEYKKLRPQIESHTIDASNQKKLAAGLKGRIALLGKIEKQAGEVIAAGDWTSQLLFLDLVGRQHERFYQEIMALPLPEGLTPEQEQEYLQALAQQAAPHQVKGKDANQKVQEFWADEKAIGQLIQSLDEATVEVRPLVENEIKILMDIAPEPAKVRLAQAMTPKNPVVAEKPSLQAIEGARAAVRNNPMDRQSILNLLELEQKWGRPAMVSYLKGRLETTNGKDTAEGVKK